MKEYNWKKVLYDVEVYPNCFLCGIKNYETKEVVVWEISERKNDFNKIKEFFQNFKGFLISFNGLHYDNCIILYLMYQGRNEDISGFLSLLKEWSDFVIKEDRWWSQKELQKYKYHKLNFTDVDLYLYWSKMLRLSKKISLKGLGIQMGYPVVQELPFDPSKNLTSSEIDKLIEYNSIHDLGILELLLKELDSEVLLRNYIKNTYGIKCMSMDAPKIASEVLLHTYCKQKGLDINETRKLHFSSQKKLPLIPISFKLKKFQELYQEMNNASRNFEKTIILNEQKTSLKISYGIGGIHSINSNEKYYQTDDELVITSDVASLYPNLLINYECIRFPEVLNKYIEVKDDRIEAKRLKQKTKDGLLKLILNSTSGLIDNSFSWLYYPEGAMRMRLMGQLIMTKTVEELVINGFKVLSINTDGAETIVPKSREEEYYKIVNSVGTLFNLIFEHESYTKIIYQHVNSYIAETEDGSIKQKGLFVETPKIGDNCDFLIIPKALKAYFIDNIPYETFIKNHKNIYDFCASKKVDKSYDVFWTTPNGVREKQQRLNRFYASKKGGYLMKCRDNSEAHLLKDSGVIIYNNYTEEFPTNINYEFYINRIRSIINDLNNNNQLKMS